MSDFLARLKQRKLVQWALAYVAAAFALIQVIDVVAQQFGWPESVRRGITLALVLGFFVTLVLAWYHGERGAQRVSGTELLILALLLALGGGWLLHYAQASQANAALSDAVTSTSSAIKPSAVATSTTSAAPVVDPKSIAVLPFANMSADKDDAFFADGLSEEIINSLTRVPDLRVAARTSSFAFRNSTYTVPQIAARLRVATVLEGSVRRSGDHLRITAQLIRAADGFDLWSEDYDRSSKDIIAIQEDVARSIAEALKTATDPKALAAMQRAGTRSVPAYDAYLQGLALHLRARDTGNYDLKEDTIKAFDEAVRIDPAFADAYAQAAIMLESDIDPTEFNPPSVFAIPYALRMKTFRQHLDAAVANARDDLDRDKYRATQAMVELHFSDALRLATGYAQKRPNDPDVLDIVAKLSLFVGDYPRAVETAEMVDRLSGPLGVKNTPMTWTLWARDAPGAAQLARQALAQQPGSIDIVYQAHRALLSIGAVKEAARLVPQLLASDLPLPSKRIVQMRQACAEGRDADAAKLYRPAQPGDEFGVPVQWQELLLLGRTEEADRLLDQFDTPDTLYALASFLVYPMFDAHRYPRLDAVLKAQGINRPPPQPESYACKPTAVPR